LVGIPFGLYALVQRLRHGRSLRELRARVGLKGCTLRELGEAAAVAAVIPSVLLLWSHSTDALSREGSAMTGFVGLGINASSIALALLFGVIQSGFAEEFLFRGMIAGSLGRRLPLLWACVLQAAIFLLPHLLALSFAPELWPGLVVIFLFSLYVGWLRLRSGSIVGPWLIHAAANVTACLLVAARTATG
jgi:membrane protease YdiL (CAAX protease family)